MCLSRAFSIAYWYVYMYSVKNFHPKRSSCEQTVGTSFLYLSILFLPSFRYVLNPPSDKNVKESRKEGNADGGIKDRHA